MSATILDRKERLNRRIALVHEFSIDRLRALHAAGHAKLKRPIVCVFQVTLRSTGWPSSSPDPMCSGPSRC
jgi:hypothetical protein